MFSINIEIKNLLWFIWDVKLGKHVPNFYVNLGTIITPFDQRFLNRKTIAKSRTRRHVTQRCQNVLCWRTESVSESESVQKYKSIECTMFLCTLKRHHLSWKSNIWNRRRIVSQNRSFMIVWVCESTLNYSS